MASDPLRDLQQIDDDRWESFRLMRELQQFQGLDALRTEMETWKRRLAWYQELSLLTEKDRESGLTMTRSPGG